MKTRHLQISTNASETVILRNTELRRRRGHFARTRSSLELEKALGPAPGRTPRVLGLNRKVAPEPTGPVLEPNTARPEIRNVCAKHNNKSATQKLKTSSGPNNRPRRKLGQASSWDSGDTRGNKRSDRRKINASTFAPSAKGKKN